MPAPWPDLAVADARRTPGYRGDITMKTYLGWFGCALAMLLAAGCGKQQGAGEPARGRWLANLQVAQAEKRDLSNTFLYRLRGAGEVARMASPAESPVVECSVREGDAVKQILVKVGRSRIAETGLDAAREEFRRQEAEFKRVAQLVKSGYFGGRTTGRGAFESEAPKQQPTAMETGASDYEIEAPWDGIVAKVWISEGNYVSPRTPLVKSTSRQALLFGCPFPEQQALAVQKDQPVSISLDAYPDRHFGGKIVRVYPELERVTRTLTAETVVSDDVRL